MPLSALSQIGNLEGNWWTGYLYASFELSDVLLIGLFFISLLCFIITRRLTQDNQSPKMTGCISFVIPFGLLFLGHFVVAPCYNYWKVGTFSVESWEWSFGDSFRRRYALDSNNYFNIYGVFRTQVYCGLYDVFSLTGVSDTTISEITASLYDKGCWLEDNNESVFPSESKKNLIWILVESLNSNVVDYCIGTEEVTPFLNSLRKKGNVFYTGRMKSNISIGESSDAQLIYLTGLLPLKNEITNTVILGKEVIALPKLLKDYGYETGITIPTPKTCWHQSEINGIWGIDSLYSTVQGTDYGNDQILFEHAAQMILSLHLHFFI